MIKEQFACDDGDVAACQIMQVISDTISARIKVVPCASESPTTRMM
jgi:hypothetical protein